MNNYLSSIQRRRKLLSLTQSDLANRAGVSQSMIAKIESEELDPSYGAATRIFSVLDELEHKDQIKAEAILTPDIEVVDISEKVSAAVNKMRSHCISQLPVIEDDKVVGLISEKTILEEITSGANPEQVAAQSVKEVMEATPPLIPKNTPLQAVSELLKNSPIIVVVDKGHRVGVITKSDLLKFVKL